MIVAASVDVRWTNAARKSAWPQTVATVTQSQDVGRTFAEANGKQNAFPDPRGTVKYVIDGKSYTWQGRGRDIGVTVMTPGETIKVHYNPQNPLEINTLVLLGASTGNLILAAALAFLVFYAWFFWIRAFLGSSGPDDSEGVVSGSSAVAAPERRSGQIGSRAAFGKR
ncbi:MAG: hypothetical protein JO000_00840 [Alphaproteobacteria bacterium]|nr:hypothetical protein [Alphaproteobacteria bacterium]